MATASQVVALPPWTLKGTIYSFMFYVSPSSAQDLQSQKTLLYSPLEASSSFSEGKLIGGLGSVQVIRYTESPVGPYDEFILVPGKVEYEVEETDKRGNLSTEKKSNLRVTRIYVSQEATCWNGRSNWNIPKHLADFEFKPLAKGAVLISVWPLETCTSGAQRTRSKSPYFSAIYKPIDYAPSFPLSTKAAKYIGLDLTLVQPPLPAGAISSETEIVGTEQWCEIKPLEWSTKTSLGWWDFETGEPKEEDAQLEGEMNAPGTESDYEYWWPELGRWRIGLMMENATIEFPEGKHWHPPEE